METEIWKDIVGYEGLYQASNLGRIKSLGNSFNKKEKILKVRIDIYGYINLYKNKTHKYKTIHRLVLEAFIPNPENKPQVNHINGIKTDNRLENLEWVNQSENMLHRFNVLGYKNNFQTNHPNKGKKGILNHLSKKVNQYEKDGEFIKTWNSMSDIKKELGINNSNICQCCQGKRKTVGGYKWEYV